ncbi:MAG: DUF881 domain-containing protein [Nocardioides sp.]
MPPTDPDRDADPATDPVRAERAWAAWLARRRGASGPPRAWQVAAPLAFGLAGALFVTSWVSSGGADLRGGRYDDLPGLAAAETRQLEQLRAEQEELTADVDRLTDRLSVAIGAKDAQEAAKSAEGPAGLVPVRGGGLTITLTDAPDAVEDTITDNVNNLVVHQQDIQAVANALWAGGAEAITIQGQRVVSTTGIRCVGNTVVLHDVPYAPPYVISAIGPPDQMLDSLNASPYIGFYLQAVAAFQLGWDVVIEPELEMPGYTGSVELDYARPAGGTGDLSDDRT